MIALNELNEICVIPAYGRDYRSKIAVLEDWNNGKDFKVVPYGCYVSKKDIPEITQTITFKYSKLQKMFVHYIGK